MKKIYSLILLVFTSVTLLFAQVPEAFNYQAIVRNSSGEIIANTNVAFRISILQGGESGPTIYAETHSATTNNFGLVNLQIGKGTVVSGVFMPGGWGVATHYIKVEIDPNGGNSFTLLGTSLLLSVPYAFHAQTVAEDAVDDADADPNNEIQALQISGTQLTLSKGGGTVTLPSSGSGGDNWGTQTVNSDATLAGKGTEADPLKVENSSIEPEWANVKNKPAGFADGEDDVNDNDADPNNEIQTLSVSGDDLSISGGNSVTLPMANKSLWNVDGDNIFRTTGFVGIGTDSPYSKLTFGGTGSELSFMDAATGVASIISWRDQGNTLLSALNYFGIEARFSLSNYATGGDIFIDARDQIVFRSDGNTKMTLFNNGDVGIGTDNPWFKLHVNGGGLFMEESGGLFIRPDENKVNIGYHSPSGYTTNAIFSWDKTQFSGNFNILNGNVGIGTENPERLLHLAGANPRILIEASSSNPEINFKSAGDAATDIWAIYKNSSTGDLHFYQNGNKLTLQKNTGNVGIGTTTPQGKLDVNGAIYQRGGVLHADYVFEENYQLESIEEHTEFMWKNRHLPAIPKATVDEFGFEIVEVGSHRKGIVEELEKAHIYISQLEKAIEKQNLIIGELKANAENSDLTKRIEKLEKIIGNLEAANE